MPDTFKLSERHEKLLRFVTAYIAHHTIAPTYGEIALAMGYVGKSSIGPLLEDLENNGYIRKLPSQARAIEVLRGLPDDMEPEAPYVATIPHFGRIQASTPASDFRQQGTLRVPSVLLRKP